MKTPEIIALNEVLKTFMLKNFKMAKSLCRNMIRSQNGFVSTDFYMIISRCCILEGDKEEFEKNAQQYAQLFKKPLEVEWVNNQSNSHFTFGDCLYFPKGRVGNEVSLSELMLFKEKLFENRIGRLVLADISFDDLTEQSERWFALANTILSDIKKTAPPILLHILTGNGLTAILSGREAQMFQLNLFQWVGDKNAYNVLSDRIFKRDGVISPDFKEKWAFNVQIADVLSYEDKPAVSLQETSIGTLRVEPELEEPSPRDWERVFEIANIAASENKVVELSLEKVRYIQYEYAKVLIEMMATAPNIYLTGDTDPIVYMLLQYIDEYD